MGAGMEMRVIDPVSGTDSGSDARYLSVPGLVDVHVHFRDPGQPEAETRATGAAAAAAGGFTAVVTMPNTSPAGDSPAWVREQIEDASLPVAIWPSACITKGRLGREVADLEALAAAGAVAFTDDGSFVEDAHVMESAMRRAEKLGIPVMQHAVVPALLAGGVLRDCAVARRFGLPTMPPEAETEAVRRDIALVRTTGCRLHVQHVSCAGTVELIRAARREGLPVTGEATPHHLLFSCDDIPADDANWKMAPPLGSREDVAAIREGVKDGTLGMFATDHAPHSAAKKAGGFRSGANGIIGLETAVAATWQAMVVEEGMSPLEWTRRWTTGPAALVGKPLLGRTLIDLKADRTVEPDMFLSRSRNQPYAGLAFQAWPKAVRDDVSMTEQEKE
ncbi:MAG: dihydroorotase [Kiritimatiellae bacterium]|nr:dihydroorotase [Kiritimatiellia bacterium]